MSEKEKLKNKIEELENELSQLKEKVQDNSSKESKEELDQEKVSRRSFLKKLGAGALGLGAASLIPSTAALDIRDSEGLKVYSDDTGYLSVSGDPIQVQNANLNMGSGNITNVGNVDGVNISNHVNNSSAHHSKYTDNDAISAINNDSDHSSTASHNYFSGSHNDLTNVGSSDHHSRYTDSEARSAIEAGNLSHISGNNNHYINFDQSSNWIEFVTGSDRTNSSNRTDIVANRIYLANNIGWFDGSHNSLSNISSNDHHSKYTDSEARSAIQSGDVSQVKFSNREYDSNLTSRELYYDWSAGLYIHSGNTPHSGRIPLVWSNQNFSAGSNISLSTSGEGAPTLSVSPQGSGSGLNADQVDGYDSSEFIQASGDTFSGYIDGRNNGDRIGVPAYSSKSNLPNGNEGDIAYVQGSGLYVYTG